MGLLTITIRTVVRLEKADTACLALIIAMTTMAIRQANQDKTCLAEETKYDADGNKTGHTVQGFFGNYNHYDDD